MAASFFLRVFNKKPKSNNETQKKVHKKSLCTANATVSQMFSQKAIECGDIEILMKYDCEVVREETIGNVNNRNRKSNPDLINA